MRKINDVNYSKESQLKLWRELIFNMDINLYEKVTNPLRTDSKPGCWLYESTNGNIVLADFGYKHISLIEAIKTKFGDLKILSNYKLDKKEDMPESKIDKTTYIDFEILMDDGKYAYTKDALKYYKTYGITLSQLRKDRTYCIERYNISKYYSGERVTLQTITYPEVCMGFVYDSGNKKIYFPNRKENKWLSTTKSSDFDLIKGNNKIILCSSKKDARVAHNLTKCTTFAGVSESFKYTKEQIELISSYEEIYSLGDADAAGNKFNLNNENIFNATTIDITKYSSIINKYGKKCKDIAEIYRSENYYDIFEGYGI